MDKNERTELINRISVMAEKMINRLSEDLYQLDLLRAEIRKLKSLGADDAD